MSFFADLQSNFDCILPDMSSIFLMKKGMSKEAAYARATTMAGLQQGVRTATGTSIETYQHDPGKPSLPGEGQGKADSMAIWTLISSEILLMHNNMCHGVEMIDVTGKKKSRRTDDAYVDDTDTYATAPQTNEVIEAVENLTNHSQLLAILVAITGQLFAFHKCMWQILFWISVAGEFLMASVTVTSWVNFGYVTPEERGTKSNEILPLNPTQGLDSLFAQLRSRNLNI